MDGLGSGFCLDLRDTAAAVSKADIATLGPAVLLNFADASSLFVGRNGAGGSPAVGGATSIGIALDKSRMAGLTASAYFASRPNMVTNGTFSTNISGWTAVSNAVLSVPTPGAGGFLRVARPAAETGFGCGAR